jgi:hypothetical protein
LPPTIQRIAELVQAVERGQVSVPAAADIATMPADDQREIVARGEREILRAAQDIRARKAEIRRAERIERLEFHFEPPSLHSITSSARASSVGVISRPSAFAVFRLITSYFVGACTGSSAGFSPLRIRSI